MHTSDLEKLFPDVDLSPTVWWLGLFCIAITRGVLGLFGVWDGLVCDNIYRQAAVRYCHRELHLGGSGCLDFTSDHNAVGRRKRRSRRRSKSKRRYNVIWPPHEASNFAYNFEGRFDARISKHFNILASNSIVLCICVIIFIKINQQTQIYIKGFVKKLRIKMVNEKHLAETAKKNIVFYNKSRANFKSRKKSY